MSFQSPKMLVTLTVFRGSLIGKPLDIMLKCEMVMKTKGENRGLILVSASMVII